MARIKKILHPTDFSDRSDQAFDMACSLARDYNAEILVVHVVAPPVVFAADGIVSPVPVEESGQIQSRLEEMTKRDSRVKIFYQLEDGEAAKNILRVAKEAQPDLIVMGTHGLTGVSRFLMGSVAESVMRNAPCPVITIREPFKKAAKTAAEPRQFANA